ncbi:hypothetical protein [uncultured Megasphaera sp.]|uniref:hypothetical protein n=1 Tax=uncultured Megasphaera sp. TaxID=165188 RepID=UPI002670A90D|nr:hypothetical protein [uncultured Megasphaera sp.]
MEIKIDMNGSDIELATFLHSLTINHSQEKQSAVKTANTKKVVKADPEPAPSDDILDDPEMADIGAHIFGEDGQNE